MGMDVDLDGGGWETGCQDFAYPDESSSEDQNIVAQGVSGRFDTPGVVRIVRYKLLIHERLDKFHVLGSDLIHHVSHACFHRA